MKKVFITCGDINGVGNELVLKYFSDKDSFDQDIFVIIGSRSVFLRTAALLGYDVQTYKQISEDQLSNISRPGLYFLDIPFSGLLHEPGKPTASAGKLSGMAIEKGVRLASENGGVLVTCPINKYSLHLGGYDYPGHTEFIAELLKTDDFLMILDGGEIKVALVTTHLPISAVPGALSTELIARKGEILYRSLVKNYKIERPYISVLSLNPHAGDGGLFGDEEPRIISPAIEKLNELTFNRGIFAGPVPSDTAFTKKNMAKTDAFLVMYHDQGLIPLKLMSFGSAVNFTAGLPIIRTSPDHGTAYDIAGKGVADIKSFKNAVQKALSFI